AGLEPSKHFPPITEDRPARKNAKPGARGNAFRPGPRGGAGKPGPHGSGFGAPRRGAEPRGPRQIGGGFKPEFTPDRRRPHSAARPEFAEAAPRARARADARSAPRSAARPESRPPARPAARAATPRAKPYTPGRSARGT
ncbi:MAG: hypothetical protein FWG56_01275, partial [Desulfovibrionaceae bacterium]|nr:hypothetical protein [Desulfovibrionaceae bacterium]